MQTINQTVEILSYITDTPRSRVNQIARALIDGGMLPKSSGRDVKKISTDKMLPLLAAVAMADRVADACEIARDFESLPCRDGFNDDETLAGWFTTLMVPGIWTRSQLEFSKTLDGHTANISGNLIKDEETEMTLNIPFWRSPTWGGFCKRSFIISSEGLENLRNLFDRKNELIFKMSPVQLEAD